jgi:uncharacterized protein YjiS (DUF1127 family)
MLTALTRPARAAPRDLWSRLVAAIHLHRSRQSLRHLDAHLLQDIGLSRAQALTEADRPLWDAPAQWRR